MKFLCYDHFLNDHEWLQQKLPSLIPRPNFSCALCGLTGELHGVREMFGLGRRLEVTRHLPSLVERGGGGGVTCETTRLQWLYGHGAKLHSQTMT